MQTTRSRLNGCVGLGIAVFLMPAQLVMASDTVPMPAALFKVPPPAFCFAPGTPPEVVEETYERAARSYESHSLAPEMSLKFQIYNRWSSTATDFPLAPARMAHINPAAPAPMMIASKSFKGVS